MDKKYNSPAIDIIVVETAGILAASMVNEKLEWESDDFVM